MTTPRTTPAEDATTADRTAASTPATVADLMHGDPVRIEANAGLVDAARLMDEHRVHGLPVVDATGHLVGVVSQTDLLRARSTEYLWSNWPGLAVRHLMTSPAVTVTAGTSLAAAAVLMEQRRIHRLVVVADDDPRLPIGILSTSDLIHGMVGAADARAADGEPRDA